jgi:hypothetical protein
MVRPVLVALAGVALLAAVFAGLAFLGRRGLPDAIEPVQIERDGQVLAPIDRSLLARTAPDFARGSTRCWRLEKLLASGSIAPSTYVMVEDAQGLRFVLATPEDTAQGRQPFVAVDARGHLRVVLATGGDALATLEGRDGHREEHATDAGRARDVRRILLRTTPASDALSASPVSISAVIDGQPATLWSRRELGAVSSLDIVPADGEGHRPAWSLRELARALVGPDARVVEVDGEEGRRVRIEQAQWDEPSRIPIVRLNRRARLKFEWVAGDLSPADGDRLREVTSVALVRGAP